MGLNDEITSESKERVKSVQEDQVPMQVLYMQLLVEKAKAQALNTPSIDLAFDPQGRLLVDVSLTLADLQTLYREHTGIKDPAQVPTNKQELQKFLEDTLGRKRTLNTTVSLDVHQNQTLKDLFYKRLEEYLNAGEETDRQLFKKQTNASALSNAYAQLPKGSVISLQEEFHFHLALTTRVYEKLLQEQGTSKTALEGPLKEAHKAAMLRVNNLVMATFAKALKAATKDKNVNISHLNKALDEARNKLRDQAQAILAEELSKKGFSLEPNLIKELETLVHNKELKGKKSKEDIEKESIKEATETYFEHIKHTAESTTATPNDILFLDGDQGLITLIAGTEETAHDRKFGKDFPHSQMLTHALNQEGGVIANKVTRMQIRTPSPVVKEERKRGSPRTKEDRVYIEDVALKLATINEEYKLKEYLSGETNNKPKAFVYNSYTSINDNRDDNPFADKLKNLQTESAQDILKGAHHYNRSQLDKDPPIFCLVQNISVNHGGSFGYSIEGGEKGALQDETALMAEIALLHTLYDTASDNDKIFIDIIFKNYEAFLQSTDESVHFNSYFAASEEGKLSRQLIQDLKKEWQKPVPSSTDDFQNAQFALRRLMAHDYHFEKSDAKTFQALSVFVEKASIGGCKSANERAQAVNNRVAVLDSAINNNERVILNDLANLAQSSDELHKNVKGLKEHVQTQMDEKGLQVAASKQSLRDQGGPAKVTVKTATSFMDSNQAESSSIKNLEAEKAAALQAHKGLVKGMIHVWENSIKQKLHDGFSALVQIDKPQAEIPKSGRDSADTDSSDLDTENGLMAMDRYNKVKVPDAAVRANNTLNPNADVDPAKAMEKTKHMRAQSGAISIARTPDPGPPSEVVTPTSTIRNIK
ncbi:MAG: hypothetical protein WC627_01915 [Legionella sp.]|jgi:hypothetical protein